ncbi:MAG TPA: TlpA disulfide reductase family protein [Terriglobia bacterium]|nr:TlpA disulfide reductase family protein [Terriglobia bacterium]
MRIRSTWFAAAVLLIVFVPGAPLGESQEAARPPASVLELADHTGQWQRLADYRGKVVVLNFWATWCGPCAKEMPIFVEAQKRYGPRGVVILAASLDAEETKAQIPEFMQKYKMNFPVLVGATVDHLHLLAMGDGLPGTVFLDAEGRVFARIFGEAKKKDVFERIEWLLGERKGKNPKPPKPILGKITLAPEPPPAEPHPAP